MFKNSAGKVNCLSNDSTKGDNVDTWASTSSNVELSTCEFKHAPKRINKSSALFRPKVSRYSYLNYLSTLVRLFINLYTQKARFDDVLVQGSFFPTDFVTVPPADRLCVKCGCVPKVPHVSNCCNQLCCEPCSVSLENVMCLKHKEVLHFAVNAELRTKLLRLRRRCINHSSGCKWKGNGRQLIQHLQNDCPLTNIKCSKSMLVEPLPLAF